MLTARGMFNLLLRHCVMCSAAECNSELYAIYEQQVLPETSGIKHIQIALSTIVFFSPFTYFHPWAVP